LTKADVAETRSFRLVLCLGACLRGFFFQGDVTSAFLQSSLDEEIYMQQLEGFGTAPYLRLKKPLYGLKQASRQWRTTFDTALRNCGLKNCEREPGIYYHLDKGSIACMLVVHVDDFCGWAVSKQMGMDFLKKLGALHEITYTTKIKSFLGFDLSWKGSWIYLSQHAYILSFLKTLGFEHVRPKRLPAQKGSVIAPLTEAEKIQPISEKSVHEFASCVGTLSYLSTHTRYDLCYVVNSLARFMHNPVPRVSNLLPDVFSYVSHTLGCAMRYGGDARNGFELVGFCDASFPNSVEPYPQIGYIFFLLAGNVWNPVSWMSHRLRHVCLSTEEAELAAASEAVREAIAFA
jgi:hypothetical protein